MSAAGFTVSEEDARRAIEEKNLGNAAYQDGDIERSVTHFTNAIRLNPTDFTFFSNRCMAFIRLERHDAALADATRVVELNPTWAKGYYRKGIAHMRRNEYVDAFGAFSKALQLEPESEALKSALAEAEQMINEHAVKSRETFVHIQQLKTASAPPACASHTATIFTNMMIVIGGSSGSTRFHDFYTLNLDTLQWNRPHLNGQKPSACLGHTATLVPGTADIVIFGGWDDNLQPRQTLYRMKADTLEWSKLSASGVPPSRRAWHTAVYVESMRGILVFGGRGVADQCYNDMHILDTDAMAWRQLTTKGRPPPPRGGHTCVVLDDMLIVWGGYGGDAFFDDMFMFNTTSLTWQKIATFGEHPTPRAGHSACLMPDNRILVFGGDNGRRRFNDIFVFDPSTSCWQTPITGGFTPSQRCVHSAAVYQSKMYIFGGADLSQGFNDLFLFDLDQLAKFEIEPNQLNCGSHPVGKGATALVYKGLFNGRTVAVKKFLPMMMEEEMWEGFRKETVVMSELKHPNILEFIGICTRPPNFWMVTDWAAHGSLFDVLHNKRIELSFSRRVRMALDCARGMQHLHERQLIHRDLKSLNLLVSEDFTVKVADFGLARIVNTNTGMTSQIGTPHWTAPEVVETKYYSTSADVYSFGIVMWELLTRDEPYRNVPNFTVYRVIEQDLRPSVPPDACVPFVQLMKRCWARDPALRPNFEEIVEQLEVITLVNELFDQTWERIRAIYPA